MDIQRRGTTERYSDSVVFNGIVYLVEVPPNPAADITAQTSALLDSMERLLIEAGSACSRLLMVTIYLKTMDDYAAMNAVWEAWLPSGTAPARACVQAQLANPAYRVEMAVVAAKI